MKKILLAVLAVLALAMMAGITLAEEGAVPVPFATIGEAVSSDGFTGVQGSDEEHCVAVVEMDGKYIRLVADMDEEAKKLGGATLEYTDAETLAAAFDAYNAYIETLPVAYAEVITAEPKPQEELDALAGRTLLEIEEAGYESGSSEMGVDDTAVYTVSFGLYDYDLLLDVTYTEYMEHSDSGYIGDLTVKSASFAGISRNAAELRWRADGTYDAENDPWGEYTAFMELITNALSGEDPDGAIQALMEAMPDRAEEIRMFADIFSSMSGQDEEPGTDTGAAAPGT